MNGTPELDQQPARRANLTPLARRVKTEGIDGLQSLPPQDPLNPSDSRIYAHKTELYALTAVLIDKLTEKVLENRVNFPSFGLTHYQGIDDVESRRRKAYIVRHLPQNRPFFWLHEAMGATYGYVGNTFFEEIDQPKHPLKRVFERYKQLLGPNYRELQSSWDPEITKDRMSQKTHEHYIAGGVGTALSVMAATLDVIPKVYTKENPGKKPKPEALIKIATISYPLIGKLAMGHIKIIPPMINLALLEDTIHHEFNPSLFYLDETSHGFRLEIDPLVAERLKNEGYVQDREDLNSPTLGCPAMVNFGEGSAVKRLWEWHLEIARLIYTDQHPQNLYQRFRKKIIR